MGKKVRPGRLIYDGEELFGSDNVSVTVTKEDEMVAIQINGAQLVIHEDTADILVGLLEEVLLGDVGLDS